MSVKIDLEYSDSLSAAKRKQLRIKYLPITSLDELKDLLKKSKLSFKKQYKFHITKFGSWFYDYVIWMKRDGFVTMTYDIDDTYSLIKKMTDKIESVYGEKLFFDSLSEAKGKKAEIDYVPEYIYQTKFTDDKILSQVLKEHGINAKLVKDTYNFVFNGLETTLYKTDAENYELKSRGKGDISPVENLLSELTTTYDKIVQHNICEAIKQKVSRSYSMQLEQEMILEDNSVLLTISI